MTSVAPARRFAMSLVMVAVVCGIVAPRRATAQLQPTREYDIKAGFLFNFMKFIDWPSEAFASSSSPINVDLLGRDPFDGALERYLEGRTIESRPIVVTHLTAPRVLPAGHVVFIASSEEKRLDPVLAAYAKEAVLTVSDIDRFADRGGVIGFVSEGRGLRFAVNRVAAEHSRLHVSSKLLALAIVVSGRPQAALLPHRYPFELAD